MYYKVYATDLCIERGGGGREGERDRDTERERERLCV